MEISLSIQVLKTVGTLITTAFAFVAGLAWNEAIKAVITDFLKAGSATSGLVIYAVVVTIIAVIVTLLLAKTLAKAGIELDDD
jgi:C4-dicarboxylate transporter